MLGFRELILELEIIFDVELLNPGEVVGSEEVDAVHLLLDGWPLDLWRWDTNLEQNYLVQNIVPFKNTYFVN